MKTGAEQIAEERQRQVTAEGWTPEHDKQHTESELAYAAVAYASPVPLYYKQDYASQIHFIEVRPFGYKIDNKKSELRRLVIAGALIAAEIDRLQSTNHPDQKG